MREYQKGPYSAEIRVHCLYCSHALLTLHALLAVLLMMGVHAQAVALALFVATESLHNFSRLAPSVIVGP